MKITILILALSQIGSASFAQTKSTAKTTPCAIPAVIKNPVPDSVKVSCEELNDLLRFMSGLVNHSSDLTGKELNGDVKVKGDIGVNGQLSTFYNKYFSKSPIAISGTKTK